MIGAIIDHPLVLLLAALGGPFVAVAAALLLARTLGWEAASDRRRRALVVGAITCLYFGLALLALATSSPRAAIVYGVLGVLWTGLAWYNRLGPGSRSEEL